MAYDYNQFAQFARENQIEDPDDLASLYEQMGSPEPMQAAPQAPVQASVEQGPIDYLGSRLAGAARGMGTLAQHAATGQIIQDIANIPGQIPDMARGMYEGIKQNPMQALYGIGVPVATAMTGAVSIPAMATAAGIGTLAGGMMDTVGKPMPDGQPRDMWNTVRPNLGPALEAAALQGGAEKLIRGVPTKPQIAAAVAPTIDDAIRPSVEFGEQMMSKIPGGDVFEQYAGPFPQFAATLRQELGPKLDAARNIPSAEKLIVASEKKAAEFAQKAVNALADDITPHLTTPDAVGAALDDILKTNSKLVATAKEALYKPADDFMRVPLQEVTDVVADPMTGMTKTTFVQEPILQGPGVIDVRDFKQQVSRIKPALIASIKAGAGEDTALSPVRSLLAEIQGMDDYVPWQYFRETRSSLNSLKRNFAEMGDRGAAMYTKMDEAAAKHLEATLVKASAPPGVVKSYRAANMLSREEGDRMKNDFIRSLNAKSADRSTGTPTQIYNAVTSDPEAFRNWRRATLEVAEIDPATGAGKWVPNTDRKAINLVNQMTRTKIQEWLDAYAKTGRPDTLKSAMFDVRGELNDMAKELLTDPFSKQNTQLMQDNWKRAMKMVEDLSPERELKAKTLRQQLMSQRAGYGLEGAFWKTLFGIPGAVMESALKTAGSTRSFTVAARALSDPQYARDVARALRLAQGGADAAMAKRIMANVMLRAKLAEIDERSGAAAPFRPTPPPSSSSGYSPASQPAANAP